MKIVLTGGGSGGHFYPLIAITESIRDIVREQKLLQVKVYYFAPTPYNASILFDNEIEFKMIHAGKIRRYFSFRNVIDIFLTCIGTIEALIKLFAIFPDVIISKGGFMSMPVVFAGKVLGIPIIIHESDSVPGRANLWASKFATKVALSYSEAGTYFDSKKVAWTGNPLRKEIIMPIAEGAREFLNLEPTVPVILVMGGSLGAKVINEALLDSLSRLVEDYQIIHQTGKYNFNEVKSTAGVVLGQSRYKDRYHPYDYLNALALRMSAGVADIIISRGGSTIFEIAAWGVPSIIVPINDSNGDHQRKNSYNYARGGGAIVIDENNLTSEVLLTEIKSILDNKERVEKMKAGALSFAKLDASYKIAEQAIDIALSHEK